MSLSVQSPPPATDTDTSCIFEKQKEYWDAWQKHMQGFDWTKIVEICNYIDHHIIAPAMCMSLLPEASLSQNQGTIKNVGSNFGTSLTESHNNNNNNNNSKISSNNVIDDPNDFSFISKESDEEDALEVLYGFRGDSEENFSSEEEIVKKKTTRKGSLSATAVGRASSSNNNGNSNGKKKVKKETEKKPSSKKSTGGSSEDLSDSLVSSSKRRRSL